MGASWRKAGLTLVELLVAVAIIILLASAVYRGTLGQAKVRTEERRVPLLLQGAKERLYEFVLVTKVGAEAQVQGREIYIIWSNGTKVAQLGLLPPTCSQPSPTTLFSASYRPLVGVELVSYLASEGGSVQIRCRYHTY
jgi:prepilin-type N-terminal cleavage/methylation domain-containing protein